jgi:hypothetical protein
MAKDAKINAGQGLSKPLSFIENKGQVKDEDNNPRYDVQYKLSTPGMNLYVGSGKLIYQFRKTEGNTAATLNVTTCTMGVTLIGANPDAKIISAEKQEYYENYYQSQSDNGFTVHSFNKIIYKNVYPGIDWVLYVKDNNVEYDFVVRPGGDAANIKLAYEGASKLSVNEDGSISAETPMGIVKEKKPFAYETGSHKEVASSFKLQNNIVSFETGDYRGSLTIDPYLLWSTYFGGANEDVATSVKTIAGGLTYVGGYSASAGLGTAGTFQQNHSAGANYDAFLIKYNALGVRTFATYFGGVGNDQGTCVAVDNAATPNVYLAGYTTSAAGGLTTGGAYHGANNGGNDGFLVKFAGATGVRTWCTFYGGTADDFIYGVACDAAGNVYITGQTASTTLVSTAGAYQTAISGPTDAFVAKFTPSGANQWSTYFGGTAQEEGLALACDASSNVIVTGQTSSVIGIATPTAFQAALHGTNDAFIAQFTTGGALNWGTYYGGEGLEQGNSIACNPTTSAIAITGNTSSLTGIASAKAAQPTNGGGLQDAFVAYFTSAGAETWSTYYGGASVDYGQGVCFDLFNNIAIAGATFSSAGISTAGSYQPAIGGDYDAYVAKFTPLGQRIWGTYFGSLFYDNANGIACDLANDELVIAGYTASTAGIATAGTQQTVYGGGTYDAFTAKFKTDTLVAINQPYNDTLVCAGNNFLVNYTTNFNFQPGNTFTLQLSSATGSFAAPTSVGVVTSSTSGSIPCIIPAGISGTGYRLRIVSSNPAFISPDDFFNINIVAAFPPTTATGTTPICVGATLDLFDASNYAITSYSWTGPAGSGLGGLGFTAFVQNPTNTGFSGTGVTTADAGTYSVVTTHNGCPASTSTVNIVVNKDLPPTPSDSGTTPGCVGSNVYLFANSDTSAFVTYYWTGPGGFTSTLQNPVLVSVTGANAGVYSVTDTMAGCPSAVNTFTVVVSPVNPVSVNITASPTDTFCAGTLVTFTATTITGGISPAYQWMTGAGSPVVGAVSPTWASSTLINGETVYCVMTSDIICPSPVNANSNVLTMDVIDTPPLVNISVSPGTYVAVGENVSFTAYVYAGGTAPTYQWSVNGIAVPGATSSTFLLNNVTQRDTVTVTVTSNMTCAVPNFNTATAIVHPSTVGVANVASALDNIELFPNPNNGTFSIQGDMQNTDISNVSFQVYNLLGQLVYADNATVQNNKLNKTFDIANTPDGIYLMNITGDEGQSKIIRFTVQH